MHSHIVSYTIGQDVYSFEKLTMKEGIPILGKILPLLLPLAGIVADQIQSGSPDIESTIWTSLTASLAHNLRDPEVLQVTEEVIPKLWKNSQEVDIDQEFRGRLTEYLDLISFALQENFLDYFLKKLEPLGLQVTSLQGLKDLVASMLVQPVKPSQPRKRGTKASAKKTS